MAAAGASVWLGREDMVNALLPHVRDFLQQIWGKDLKPRLVYEAPWKYEKADAVLEAVSAWYVAALNRDRGRETRAGRTMIGPHLDDLVPQLGGHTVGGMASRGELRSLSLSLKFAEVALIESLVQQRPLLLLDDVMSELDQPHRRKIEQLTNGHQTIYTTTDLMFFSPEFLDKAEVVRLHQGALEEVAA
jgi:DNA replication and repair protein RecF